MSHTGTPDQPGTEPPPDMKRVKARISLFFDGTGNNRANTNHRLRNTWTYTVMSYSPVPTGSYENAFSNVSLIEEQVADTAAGYDYYLHVYVAGIGTQDDENDDIPGLSKGAGYRGITVRVEQAIALAGYRLALTYAAGAAPVYFELISIDMCGFSRGAAAARHCVHRVLKDPRIGMKPRLENVGWRVGRVEVRAVGLFDTVSSYDNSYTGTNFSNDTAELQLDAIREATAVYQLAAAEEYRINFALTNIDSAAGKGRLVYLPGAHSDIGGGYVEGAPEKKALAVGAATADPVVRFVRPRGWYRTSGPSPELRYTPAFHAVSVTPAGAVPVDMDARVDVDRRSVSTKYSYIPLGLMAEFFRQQQVPVRPLLEAQNDPGEVPAKASILAYAASIHGVNDSAPSRWDGIDPELGQLRHRFLHVSYSDSIGMGVRIDGGRPSREVHDG